MRKIAVNEWLLHRPNACNWLPIASKDNGFPRLDAPDNRIEIGLGDLD